MFVQAATEISIIDTADVQSWLNYHAISMEWSFNVIHQ